jgi:anaerobic selenocysteine-containing dehydrogenase
MCHESTSVGLLEAIGSAVGTTTIEDLDEKTAFFLRAESGYLLAAGAAPAGERA